MLLTDSYQIVKTTQLDYGQLRTYAKYVSQDTIANATTYQVKSVYFVPSTLASIRFYSISNRLGTSTKNYPNYTTFYRGETIMQELTFEAEHEADGSSPTVNIQDYLYDSMDVNTTPVTQNIELTFPKINRLDSVTINNNSLYTVDSAENTPTTVNAHLNNYVEGYTSTMRVLMKNNQDETYQVRNYQSIDSNLSSFSFTASELQFIYEHTGFKFFNLIFEVKTFDGNEELGSVETLISACLSNTDLNPTASATFLETNQKVVSILGNSASSLVRYVSKPRITVTPVGHKGATISNVQVSFEDKTKQYTSPYQDTYDVNTLSGLFTIGVTDNRGYGLSQSLNYQKSVIDYLPISIKSFSFVRESMVSSNLILNAEIQYYQTNFGNTPNAPTIKWKKGSNGTLNTVSSNDYVIDTTNKVIKITDLELTNVIPYDEQDNLYLIVNDLLTDHQDSVTVIKGIPTFDYGEHDLQVNGKLYVADERAENKKEVALKETVDALTLTVSNIIESGFNANGSYVKYSDGTMICYMAKAFSQDGGWSQDSTMYYKNIENINFPQEFIAPPTINGSFVATGNRYCWVCFRNVAKDKIGVTTINTYWDATGTAGAINIIAIGKWK